MVLSAATINPLLPQSCRPQQGVTSCNPVRGAAGRSDRRRRILLLLVSPTSSSSCFPFNGDWRRTLLILLVFSVVCLPGRSKRGGDPASSSSLLSTGGSSFPLVSSSSSIAALDRDGSSFSSRCAWEECGLGALERRGCGTWEGRDGSNTRPATTSGRDETTGANQQASDSGCTHGGNVGSWNSSPCEWERL